MIRGFGSDNFSGVLPEVFKALEEASYGHQHSYGEDEYSAKAIADFKAIFGEHIEVFLYTTAQEPISSAYQLLHVRTMLSFVQKQHTSMLTNVELLKNKVAVSY